MKKFTRDDTEHGKEYYLASDVDALMAQPEQEPVAHCEAGPNYCWKCLEESNPTYGSEEIKKLREVNKSLVKNIEQLKKEPPPFWPVVQHLLDEYGLQFIDVVAAYREATQPEQEPVPVEWMEMVTANLVREGIQKHKARDLAEHFYSLSQSAPYMAVSNDRMSVDPHTGNVSIGTVAQRTWVGLTGDEYAKLAEEFGPFPINQIEAKLKQLNHG
jgi:hypothetical protein